MKKNLLFSLTACLFLYAAKAQTTMQRPHTTVTPARNQPGTSYNPNRTSEDARLNNNSSSRNGQNPLNHMKYIPRPNPFHFMTRLSKLEPQTGAGPVANNVMDRKTNPTSGTRQKGSAYFNNHSEVATMMMPTFTRSTPDHKKVTYTLTTDIGTWENKPSYAAKVANASAPKSDGQWTCTTSTLSINARSTTFMNPHPDQQGSMLIPGMLYTFDDYSAGNFNQQYNVNRNPVTLVSSVLNSPSPVSANVTDPNMGNLSNGIRSIISQYAPGQSGSDYQIQATLTDNNSDQDIFVSAGGSYGAFEGSASFRHQQNDHHIYYTIDAVKSMYTINAQPAGNGVFANGAAPTTNSPLLMLQSVTYGARILANMDIEVKSTSDLGKLHLSYNDGMESARTDMEALFANNTVNITINGYLIGFPTQFSGSFTATKDNFFKLMDQFFSGCNYLTCKPIQYSMVNMEGNQVGIYSATDNFVIQECNPSDETFTLQSVMAVIQTGNDAKNSNSEFWLTIGAGDANHIRWAGQYYDNHSEFKKDGNSYQIPIPLNGAYTEADFSNGGLIALKLLEHGHSADDWDFQDLKLIFNFVSQKGTPKVKNLDIANFTLHDTKDARQDSKQIYFQPASAVTYAPLQ